MIVIISSCFGFLKLCNITCPGRICLFSGDRINYLPDLMSVYFAEYGMNTAKVSAVLTKSANKTKVIATCLTFQNTQEWRFPF